MLAISSRVISDAIILDLSGRFSFMEYGLHERAKQLAEEGHRAFVLNLSEVSYIDSFAIGQMFSIWTSIRAKGGKVVLLQPNKRVHDALQVARLDTIFQVFMDEDHAVAEAKTA